MLRKDREVTDFGRILSIIDECPILRLGIADGVFPYIVPMNFAYTADGDRIRLYIHGAMAGRKFELLSAQPYCSFEMDVPMGIECMPEAKDVTMRYRSVMGTARAVLLDGEEKQRALDDIIMKRYEETSDFEYNKVRVSKTAIFKLEVLSLTAKENLPQAGPD